MTVLASIADIRDVIIIIYGIIGIIFFFAAMIVVLILGFTVKNLLGAVRGVLDDSVKPTMESIKGAAETVRGTTEFVGRTAVTPIVRTYGMAAGVKKGLGVLGGFRNRGRARS